MKKESMLGNSSKGEIQIYLHLSKLGVEFNQEKSFKDLLSDRKHPLRFDFYLPEYNLCIEYQGLQHYEFVEEFFNSEEEFNYYIKNDERKVEYCRERKINLLTIKYTKFDNIGSLINDKLSKIERSKGVEGIFNKETKAQVRRRKEDFSSKRYIKRLRTKFKELNSIEDLRLLERELIVFKKDLFGQAKGTCTHLLKDIEKKIKKLYSELFSEEEKTAYREVKEIKIKVEIKKKAPIKRQKTKPTKEGKREITLTKQKPQSYYDNLEFQR